jgi:methyl-accepting chemotaxis protein
MKISDLKISSRLNLGLGMLLVIIGVMAGMGVYELRKIGNATKTMTDEALRKERAVEVWLSGIDSNAVRTLSLAEITDPEAAERLRAEQAERSKVIDKAQKQIEESNKTPEEVVLIEKARVARELYTSKRRQVFALIADGKLAEAKAMTSQKLIPAMKAYIASVTAIKDFEHGIINDAARSIDGAYQTGLSLLVGLGIGGMLLGAGLSLLLAKSITTPLNKAVAIARTVASGDLTSTIEVESRDETGILIQSLKDMNDNLLSTVSRVMSSTESINAAALQIASGNQNLSSRTAAQSSSLEETAAALEEMTAAVKRNADNANLANQLAGSASQVANRGGKVVSQVVEVMDSIEKSSKKVAEIITVIDSIAFQTNILALNAAVEAARAGEMGRGFGVVAAEVRMLAQRSAEAAKEIKKLIVESVDQVSSGADLVENAGSTMQEVVASIGKVASVMSDISIASSEQTSGIEQVNESMVVMEEGTQQNAALVEEAAAASLQMREQTNALAGIVSEFKIHREGF